jgi:hypothetical protein
MASEWYYDNDYKDEYSEPDEDDEWACEFGERCLMPSFTHRRSECYTVEMAQAWQDERETAA